MDYNAELHKDAKYFIAIPATWFNDHHYDAYCTKHGIDVNTTFFTAYLVGTQQTPTRIVFNICKDASSQPRLAMTAKSASAYRSNWILHGRRNAPIYSLTNTGPATVPDPTGLPPFFHPDPDAPKKWRWEKLDTPHGFKRLGAEFEPYYIHDVLDEQLRILLARDNIRTFNYSNNSCHLDTWLMVQLAFYTYRRENSAGSMMFMWPEAHRKLFRVLSCITKPEVAQANRDLYRAYEERASKHKAARMGINNRHRHGQHDDYAIHTSILVRVGQRELKPGPASGEDAGKEYGWDLSGLPAKTFAVKTQMDRLVGVYASTPCTDCAHAGNEERYFWHASIPATRRWWPMSDRDANAQGLLDLSAVYRRQHATMRDVLLSHVGRNDWTQIPCQMHDGHAPPHAYTVKFKNGQRAHFPNLLELDNLDIHSQAGSADPTCTFSLGNDLFEHVTLFRGCKYRMIAMTFYNGAHYMASVLLHDHWYRYDDTGHKRERNLPRTEGHLLLCPGGFQEAATPLHGYSHRTYVFSLEGEEHYPPAPEHRVDWTAFEDAQFENLDTLAATDDEAPPTSPII